MSEIMVIEELGCAYRWSDKFKQLEWSPLYMGIVDMDEFSCVEEDKVGEEEVMYKGERTTLSKLYREIEFKLGVS